MTLACHLAQRAILDGLSDPVLFSLRSFWHEQNGRFPEAAADLRQADLLAPRDPRTLSALSRCLAGANQSEEALAASEAAIAIDPQMARAHYNRGVAQEQLKQLNEAQKSYVKATELDPSLLDAFERNAGLAARRGRSAEARVWAQRTLALDPHNSHAQSSLILCDLSDRRFSQAVQAAQDLLRRGDLPAPLRGSVQFYRADALDGQNRTSEAFDAYREGNSLLRSLAQAQFEAPNAERPVSLITRLEREFGHIPGDAWLSASQTNNEAAQHIFVLGFPRSGTTLLGQILASHPLVETLEEWPALSEPEDAFIRRPGRLQALASLPSADIARWRKGYWDYIRRMGVDVRGKVVVDKVPMNTVNLPLIAKLFPEARIVFALRDPRDVILSCFRRPFLANYYTYEFLELENAAALYDATMRLEAVYRPALPLKTLDVRNEDIIADFSLEARKLCEFCGLAWDSRIEDFARLSQERNIATPSAHQVAKGINSDGLQQWRRYDAQLASVRNLLAPWVKKFGYPTS